MSTTRKTRPTANKKASGGQSVHFTADPATLSRLRWAALAVEFITGERHSQSTLLRRAIELLAEDMDATLGEHAFRNQKPATRSWIIRHQAGRTLRWPTLPDTADGLERVPRLSELQMAEAAATSGDLRAMLARASRIPFPGEVLREVDDE